ncbi:hypothetical protein ACFFMR_32565 [Micromonospora andamanensis]|uniref:hypothetical protein n=1 Tax=Micromonospora andamanensis TaxID=1287068 RepID=UPI0019504749|nr:hypothetical protein [Micromonospora andamanensis]
MDALVTGANGVMYLAGASVLADLFGASASLQRGAGLFLVVFAALVGWYARNRAAGPGMGWGIVAVNVAWVAGSLAVAAAGPGEFTAVGRIWLVAQAAVVGLFAVLQMRTLSVTRR